MQSFLQQDYEGDSELIIFSDYAEQQLSYRGDKRIKIVNHTERIQPLAKVFNSAIALCQGDIIMPWESDDIFLPHRMSLTVEKIVDGFFHSNNAWFYDQGDDRLEEFGNYCLCNLAASKELWKEVGYFAVEDRPGVDVDLLGAMYTITGQSPQKLTTREAFYIYRWNNGSYHASGWGDKDGMGKRVENWVDISDIPRGDIELMPHWEKDYRLMIEKYIKERE
jgi:glycosyltransferase involved in cell wall biosynthesis